MLRFFASLAVLVGLAAALAMSADAAREPPALLTIEPGADAPSLDALKVIAGATVRYDDAARVVYHGDAPVSVAIRLDAAPAWTLLSPAVLTMKRGEIVPIAIEITLAEGEASAGRAVLTADVLPRPPRPLPTR